MGTTGASRARCDDGARVAAIRSLHGVHAAIRFAGGALALAIGAAGCGETASPDGAGGPAPPSTVTLSPDAPPLPGESECKVVITTGISVASAQHVPVCTPVAYATNPPSGGDHWPVWAPYGEHDTPVPREVYVHDMEHGAVVLSYRCASACPEVVATLQSVLATAKADPTCLMSPSGPAARLLLTPDNDLPTPVAAAAWGATYTATCLDTESLSSFVAQAYNRGPEDTCANGAWVDDPDAGAPACDTGAPGG